MFNLKTVNRTDVIDWVHMRESNRFRGLSVTKIENGYEILWLEKVDFDTNPLKVRISIIIYTLQYIKLIVLSVQNFI